MFSFTSLLSVVHLVGLALAVGAATVKLALLIRCRTNDSFVAVYLEVTRPITRQIILGLILLTLSGIGWLFVGYPFSALLVVKIVLVVVIWAMGPIIDNVVEPKFRGLAPGPGEAASASFVRSRNQYLAMEAIATGLFYVIIVMWSLR